MDLNDLATLKFELPELGYYFGYKHRPGDLACHHAYEVVGFALDASDKGRELPFDEQLLVLYRPLDPGILVFRANVQLGIPLCDSKTFKDFMAPAIVGGAEVPRYRRVTDECDIDRLAMLRIQYPDASRSHISMVAAERLATGKA